MFSSLSPTVHRGIQAAVATAFLGASWQMCQVHTTQAVLRNVPKKDQREVADLLREAYGSEERLQACADTLNERGYPKAATTIERFLPGLLKYTALPKAHGKRIRTTNVMDMAYNAEAIHRFIVKDLKAEALILARKFTGTVVTGRYRSRACDQFDPSRYHQRAAVETILYHEIKMGGTPYRSKTEEPAKRNETQTDRLCSGGARNTRCTMVNPTFSSEPILGMILG